MAVVFSTYLGVQRVKSSNSGYFGHSWDKPILLLSVCLARVMRRNANISGQTRTSNGRQQTDSRDWSSFRFGSFFNINLSVEPSCCKHQVLSQWRRHLLDNNNNVIRTKSTCRCCYWSLLSFRFWSQLLLLRGYWCLVQRLNY